MLVAFTIGQRWIAGKSRWRGFSSLGRGLKEGPSRSLFGITGVGTELLMGVLVLSHQWAREISCHHPEPPYSIPGLLMCSPGGNG